MFVMSFEMADLPESWKINDTMTRSLANVRNVGAGDRNWSPSAHLWHLKQ